MTILNSSFVDIDEIFKIYDEAMAHQKKVTTRGWKGFERSLIEKEINENRHYIIKEGNVIACTFVITLDDPVIWKEKNDDAAIYLHRIAVRPAYKGNSYVKKIIEWAKGYAKENHLNYIRLDTHSGNDKINQYYIDCGFTYLGETEIEWTTDLPLHYKEGPFSIFEIRLQS